MKKEATITHIYDEELRGDSPPNKSFTTSKALPMKPQEPSVFPEPTRKVWSAPLCSREKLIETLNALEQEQYQIFTVLTVSTSLVQIVCFQEEYVRIKE